MLGPVLSPVSLPTTPAERDAVAEWSVEIGAPSQPEPIPDGNPTIRRQDQIVEMTFGSVALVRIDLSQHAIEIRPSPNFEPSRLGSLIVDQVIPRIASDSHLVLHGGAVVRPEHAGAILVVGASGAGKSTLVTRWCLDGSLLLGDDTIRVDGAVAACSFVGPRLWRSSAIALGIDGGAHDAAQSDLKRRLGPADGIILADTATPVERIVLLGALPATSPRLTAVRLLGEQALDLGNFDPIWLIERVTALVDAVPEIEARPAWTSVEN
jgi:hypothetical protein